MFTVYPPFPKSSSPLDLLPKFSKRRALYPLFNIEATKLFVGKVKSKKDDIDLLFEEEPKNLKKRSLLDSGPPEESSSKRTLTHKLDEMTRQIEKQMKQPLVKAPETKRTKQNPFDHEKLNDVLNEIRKEHRMGALGMIPNYFHLMDEVNIPPNVVEMIEYFFNKSIS